jgi:transcriptional regulator with XRE-family HTH domain
MPNIHPGAKAWEADLAARVGRAVYRRRKALGLTAQQLAQRTTDLGYPVTRVAVSKIEGNTRAGKLDVAELLVLSAALRIPPVLLLLPGYGRSNDAVEILPGRKAESSDAARWFGGLVPSNYVGLGGMYEWGEELVETRDSIGYEERELARMWRQLAELQATKGSSRDAIRQLKRDIETHKKLLNELRARLTRIIDELWGGDE